MIKFFAKFFLLFLISFSLRAEIPTYKTTIKNHVFEPSLIEVLENQKFKLIVKNNDSTPEEFESHDLNREKIIPGNKSATFLVGPLKKGEYKFFGEFNEDSAKGIIFVK